VSKPDIRSVASAQVVPSGTEMNCLITSPTQYQKLIIISILEDGVEYEPFHTNPNIEKGDTNLSRDSIQNTGMN